MGKLSRNEIIARALYAGELEIRRWATKAAKAGDNLMAAGHTLAAKHVHARWLDAASKLEDEYRRN